MEKCYAIHQKEINHDMEKIISKIESEEFKLHERLRTCKAWVYESENYYALHSYSTYIAVIDKNTRILYDFLRMVYGYTATSAQHIAKFRQDYCAKSTLTWRDV